MARADDGPLALTVDRVAAPGLRLRQWRHHHPGHNTPPTAAHDDVEISWIEQGCVTFGLGRQRPIDVTAGQAIVVPAHVEHRSSFRGITVGRSLKLSLESVSAAAETLGRHQRAEPASGPLPAASRLVTLARLIYDEAARGDRAQGDRAQEEMLDALSRALAIELARSSSHGPYDELAGVTALDPRIAAARRLIEGRFAEPLSIDDLARAAGMSRYHFGRRFRALIGKTPYAYLLETRVKRAAELLEAGGLNVTEAALAVGFNELGRFSRRFRAVTGLSPADYRQRGALGAG